MNNKRQTIWLVSMLSLMVILSAYYLFTEDVTPAQKASNGSQQAEVSDGASKATGNADEGVQVTEIGDATDSIGGNNGAKQDEALGDGASADGKTDGQSASKTDGTDNQAAADSGNPDGKTDGTDNQAAADSANPDGKTDGTDNQAAADSANPDGKTDTSSSADSAVSPGDEAVLKEMTSLKGSQLITSLQRKKLEDYDKRSEELNAVIADTKNHTQEDASNAYEKLAKLEDADSRMTRLEEKLQQDYENAVVMEEETNFKVVVQAAKLEKKQAVQIITMATKELNVTPDRLSVQYVP